jgi:hypothetical protein
MRIAYIVSAYKRPEQLARLVSHHGQSASAIAVHVDAKTHRREFDAMVDGVRDVPGAYFLPRHRCYWGGFGHVRASLKGIEHLVESGVGFDYAVLLTGQDYPLQSDDDLRRFFALADGRSYLSYWRLPFAPWGTRGGLDRVEQRHLLGPRRLHVRLPGRRDLPDGLQTFGGSPYWALARPVVEWLHGYVRRRPDVVRFFERAYIPDELFFQSVVLSSEHAGSIVNENLRYIDWQATPAPKILTIADVPAMLASGALFARKFDTLVDSEVLDMLDRRLAGEAQ